MNILLEKMNLDASIQWPGQNSSKRRKMKDRFKGNYMYIVSIIDYANILREEPLMIWGGRAKAGKKTQLLLAQEKKLNSTTWKKKKTQLNNLEEKKTQLNNPEEKKTQLNNPEEKKLNSTTWKKKKVQR